MSAEKKVITIKGEELPISKCRKFNTLYYKIGDVNIQNSGDCYLINGKCYREETGLIVYNHSVKEYVMLDNNLIVGVVDFIESKLIMGYFNNNVKYSKIVDYTGNSYVLFNSKIFKNNKEYRERLCDGNFYHISKLNAKQFNLITFPDKHYKHSLPYDSKRIIETNLKNYNENYNPEISKNIENYAPLLENLSFGLEFETTKGFIPNRILNQYGLIPLRDGSISGIEYVTVPMEGKKGLQCTADILKVLKERTKYEDETCSLHLHLGNIPRTKEFILAFFKIGMQIQDEMFQMFPLYKKYNYHIKNKNYSAPLPTFEILSQLDSNISSENIDANFGVLYKYLSMGQNFKSVGNSLDNVISHPADTNGNQKWNIISRYLLYNVIPLIFGNKQTIEFRIHTPTYEVNKIIPFIFMNSLIVNFTIQNQNSILSNKGKLNNYKLLDILLTQIDTYDILNRDKFKDLMYDYINKRKNCCERQILKGNVLGTESEIIGPKNIDWISDQEIKKNFYINSVVETDLQPLKLYTIDKSKSKSTSPEGLCDCIKSIQPMSFSSAVDISSRNFDNIGIINQMESGEKLDNLKIQTNDIAF